MKQIQLTKGYVALVDDEDFEFCSKINWRVLIQQKRRYAYDANCNASMHLFIMNTPKGMVIDHIDGNGLNNQKSNLRICTQKQNSRNRGKSSNNKSGYKGVSRIKSSKKIPKWVAQIFVDRKNIYLGSFLTKEQAYKKYCEAAIFYHKEFASFG